MRVAVAEGAAVKDRAAVEEAAVEIRGGGEALHEAREELDVEAVDLRHLLDEVGMAAVVRQRVVRVGDANLRVDANAAFAAQHHGGDAGEVGLERDGLQLEHQLDVGGIVERDAGRLLVRRRHRIALACRDLQLDLADAGEVLVHAAAVGRAEAGLEARGILARMVENTLAIEGATCTDIGGQARVDGTEEALEYGSRIDFDGQWRVGILPREAVRVGAARPSVAVADHAGILAADLERGHTRLGGPTRRRELVEGPAGMNVGSRGVLHFRAREEAARRLRMAAAARLLSRAIGETRENGDVLAEGLERLENAGE